jgi:uncharacterized membrane protein
MNSVAILFYSFLYALMNVTGVTILKFHIGNSQLNSFSDYMQLLFKPGVILGFSIVFLSALLIFKALSIGKFSIIGPLATGINFMLTVFVGVMFFNDKLGFQSYIGLVFILAGITLISIQA